MNDLKILSPLFLASFVLSFCFLITPSLALADFLKSTGKITMLRVQQVGEGFGPSNDKIDVEVVMGLSTKPGMGFGFQLRSDNNRVAHQGMLDLLRDALNHNHDITIAYNIDLGNDVSPAKKNGTIVRAWLTK